MSKQKIMYIIAIVLLVGGSINGASAESLVVDTSIPEVVEGAVRNDTLDVDVEADSETEVTTTQQNTVNEQEKIAQAFGTGSTLSLTVDQLIAGTIRSGITVDSDTFCTTLDSTLMKQSDTARASLAWNATSYQKNINLKYQGMDGAQASLHESTQGAFKNISQTLKTLSPRSDKAIDAVMLSRYQAIARSALVEMNMNLKAKNIDAVKTNELASLLGGAMKCAETYVSTDESSTASFSAVKTTLGEIVAGWDANKNSFGVEGSAEVKEPFYLKVSSKDVGTTDEVYVDASEKVTTKEDLSSYIKSTMNKDSELKDVIIDDSSVTLKYATKAKLFGFIPVWLTPKTTVNTDGEVIVKYPWYSGLSSKKVKLSSEKIKTELIDLGLVSAEAPVEPVSEMSMQYRARIVEALDMTVKSHLEVKMDSQSSEETVEEIQDSSDESSTEPAVVESAPQA